MKLPISMQTPAGWAKVGIAERFESNTEAVQWGIQYRDDNNTPVALVYSKTLQDRFDVIARDLPKMNVPRIRETFQRTALAMVQKLEDVEILGPCGKCVPGDFKTYKAAVEVTLGDVYKNSESSAHVLVGQLVDTDGFTVKYGDKTFKCPHIKGAIADKWFVLVDDGGES
jgi:hypothetical protein